MTYSISDDKKTLTLYAEEWERDEFREHKQANPNGFGTWQHEAEAMGQLLCNSELDWIQPHECGDLTDAPILGFRDENGGATGERWGFMSYCLRSFLEDLMDKGEAKFTAP